MPSTAQPISQEMHLHNAFAQAWKEGVLLAGPSLFGCQAAKPEAARHWHQLAPKLELMRKAVTNKSQAEAFLIAVMASFYNGAEGQKLLDKAGLSFGEGALIAGDKARSVIARLFASYRGW